MGGGGSGGGWVVCILSCGVSHDTMHVSGEMSESMSCHIVLGEGGVICHVTLCLGSGDPSAVSCSP